MATLSLVKQGAEAPEPESKTVTPPQTPDAATEFPARADYGMENFTQSLAWIQSAVGDLGTYLKRVDHLEGEVIEQLKREARGLHQALAEGERRIGCALERVKLALRAEGFAPIPQVDPIDIICGVICPETGYEVVGFLQHEGDTVSGCLAFRRPGERKEDLYAAAWVYDPKGLKEIREAQAVVEQRLRDRLAPMPHQAPCRPVSVDRPRSRRR